jgi:hypothetical protein
MSEHYTEVDLLETYYADAESAGVVGLHVSGCERCTMTLGRLKIKMMTPAPGSCSADSKPEPFWERQRSSIMNKIGVRSRRTIQTQRFSRIAAAAAVSFLLGGAVVYETTLPSPPSKAVTHPTTVDAAASSAFEDRTRDELTSVPDPWQSDELSDFHNVVSWQSWVTDNDAKGGAL